MATIGLIQMMCINDAESNMKKSLQMIDAAAQKGAQIVCTQELFKTPYFCQTENHDNFALAETIDASSVTVKTLQEKALQHEIVIIASLFEKRTQGIYHNSAIVIDADGTYMGKYRKMHIPDDPQYYEKYYFTEGDLGYQVFDTKYARIGVLICWDQWYPEAARIAALKGAQILFYPTAIGWLPHDKECFGDAQHNAWEMMQRSHAIANGCYVATVNRVGREIEPSTKSCIEFWGQSFVAGPDGCICDKATNNSEEVLTVACDLQAIDRARTAWPFMRDRRIESYKEITERFID